MIERLGRLLILVAVFACVPRAGHAQIRAYLNSPESAAESERGRALLEQVQQELDLIERAPQARHCGTGLADLLASQIDHLTLAGRDIVRHALPGLLNRPSPLSDTFDVPTAPFRIHYTTTGDDAVLNASDTAADGVPTYVHVAADALAWAYELFEDSLAYFEQLTDALGYGIPLFDGSLGGGADLYDCYLTQRDLSPGVVGFTAKDLPGFFRVTGNDTIYLNSSFQVVHSTMEPFPQLGDPLDLLRITCAHELFHALHFSLDANEKPPTQIWSGWWLEGNAVWFEDVAFPDINDWSNLTPYLAEPERSITSSRSRTDLHPYGGGSMWCFFLVERFGAVYPLGPADIIRRIWDRCARVGGDNTLAATDSLLQADFGVTLDEAWFEFSSWCMRTGSRWDGSSFLQGAQWPEVPNSDDPGPRRLFRYPAAVHFTQGTDTLDRIVAPGTPIVSVAAGDYALESLAFGPAVTLIPIPAKGGTFRVRPHSDDSATTAFFYLGRDTASVTPAWDLGNMPFGVPTPLANWSTYDSVMIVAAAGARIDSITPDGPILRDFTPMLITAADTGITLVQTVSFLEAFPNPLRLDQGDEVHFRLVVAEPLDVFLDIFTLSGDRVRSDVVRRAINVVDIAWDGTNQTRRPVASGLYLCKITAGEAEKLYRIGVLR